MKIRIKGNSLRLRLMQSEVEQFEQIGKIEEKIEFGLGNDLKYSLLISEEDQIRAAFSDANIKILVPKDLAHQWTSTDLIGLEYFNESEEGKGLRILIEKDFKCLTKRPHEDESNAYPHPREHDLVC